jgi:hypothetical protein
VRCVIRQRGEGGGAREESESNEVIIRVGPSGEGYDLYRGFLEQSACIMSPLRLAAFESVMSGGLDRYMDYEVAMAVIVVYEMSVRIHALRNEGGEVAARTLPRAATDDLLTGLTVARKYGIGVDYRLWLVERYEKGSGRKVVEEAQGEMSTGKPPFWM